MSLASDIYNTVMSMRDITQDGEKYFSEHITTNVKDYFEALACSTSNISGTVSAGVYSLGTGSGNPDASPNESSCESKIYQAEMSMRDGSRDDDWFAEELSDSFHLLCTGALLDFNVTGNLVMPNGSVNPAYIGEVKGNPAGINSGMTAGFKVVFKAMRSITEDGERYFADNVAMCVEQYATTALTVTLKGQDNIAGSAGTGKLS